MGKNKFVEIGLSHSIRSHVINISNSVEMPEQRNYFRTNRPGPIGNYLILVLCQHTL